MKIAWAIALALTAGTLNQSAAEDLAAPVVLDVPLVTQQTEVWCWLAVTEMALLYRNRGIAPRQCEIIGAGRNVGSGLCCEQPLSCARTGTIREIRFALARFGNVSSEFAPPVNFGVLYRVLRDGYPVIIGYSTGANSAHVVIARGMKIHRSGSRVTPMVLVNDPMASKPLWVPYKQLRETWLSSVAIGPPDL